MSKDFVPFHYGALIADGTADAQRAYIRFGKGRALVHHMLCEQEYSKQAMRLAHGVADAIEGFAKWLYYPDDPHRYQGRPEQTIYRLTLSAKTRYRDGVIPRRVWDVKAQEWITVAGYSSGTAEWNLEKLIKTLRGLTKLVRHYDELRHLVVDCRPTDVEYWQVAPGPIPAIWNPQKGCWETKEESKGLAIVERLEKSMQKLCTVPDNMEHERQLLRVAQYWRNAASERKAEGDDHNAGLCRVRADTIEQYLFERGYPYVKPSYGE